MPLYGTDSSLGLNKLAGLSHCRVITPVVLHPASFREPRQDVPAGVCLATSGGGSSRKLSQAARDYAAGMLLLQRLLALSLRVAAKC